MDLRKLIIGALLAQVGSMSHVAEAASVQAPPPMAPDTVTTLSLPDGTVFYVRYGKPGGVRIRSHNVAGDSLSLAPTALQSSNEDLVAQLRSIIRSELQAMGRPVRPEPVAVTERPRPGTLGGTAVSPTPLVIVDQRSPRPPQAVADTTATVVPTAEPTLAASTESASKDSTAIEPTAPVVAVDAAQVAALQQEMATPVEPTVVREQILDGGMFRTNLILFETSKASLLSRSQEVLMTIGNVLREFPDARIQVEGHADPRGSEAANLLLSRQRADAVRDFLLSCCELAPERIVAVGYGESRPIVTGTSPTELALNRRVEFRVLNPEALRTTQREERTP